MRDLSAVAQQLRSVRQARQKFLGLWALEQAVILPALDRVAEDLIAECGTSDSANLQFRVNAKQPRDDQ